MRLLAVKQPWASLIVLGHKPVENRSRATPYRGDVAIIASSHADYGTWATQMATGRTETRTRDLPRGVILGVVELYDVVRDMQSEWFRGPFGYLLRNPRPLRTPIPIKGKLGLYYCEPELEQQIRNAL